ncbi:MAG: hypothetical protein IKA02_03725 [Clostridia bacterium]|nr:hypothetical protein [Clostridia bacterium]
MKNDIKKAVGKPDNSAFIKRFLIYGIILAVMIFFAPSIFSKIMVPMASNGMKTAWYLVFVLLTAIIIAIGLFRSYRRRWSLSYMENYKKEAKENEYEYCPRCGAEFVLKRRTRNSRVKTGELITTTTYSDGSKTVDKKDVYGTQSYTEYYHKCTDNSCGLEPEQVITQSHLPWKTNEIRHLILNEDSSKKKRTSAHDLLLSRLFAPILAIVIFVACAICIYSYANLHDGEWTYATADKESSRSANEYQEYLLSLDTLNPNYHMTYEIESADMLSHLLDTFNIKDKNKGYTVSHYSLNGESVFEYRFEGYDANTGIPFGWYTLCTLDGIKVLIDDTNKKIYKEGTEFYDTYAPKLLELTHDKALNVIIERTNGGEHALQGTNDFWMEFIRKDDSMIYSYMLSSDFTKISGGEFRAITTHQDTLSTEKWTFSYDDYQYTLDEFQGYVYSDGKLEDNDELGKLITASYSDSGQYTLYKNDERIVQIDIYYLANGYGYSFYIPSDKYDKDFIEDVEYRINTNTNTLTMVTIDDNYKEVFTEMDLSEHQDKYDYLLSIVPHPYIRNVIDMDKAEVQKENGGLTKNYIMKDENGNITAEMKVAFGKIGEVIHHLSENEYIKIELEY